MNITTYLSSINISSKLLMSIISDTIYDIYIHIFPFLLTFLSSPSVVCLLPLEFSQSNYCSLCLPSYFKYNYNLHLPYLHNLWLPTIKEK